MKVYKNTKGAGLSLFGAAYIYTGANIVNAAIPFLLLPVLTRVLTPTDYGIVAMFGIAVSIVSAFTGLSVHGAVSVRYFQRSKEGIARYVGACMGILLVTTALVLAFVALFNEWLERVTQVPGKWLLVAVVVSAGQFVAVILLTLWQMQRQPLRYGVFQVSQSVLNVGLSLVLVLGFRMAWEGRLLGQMLSVAVFALLGLWLLWRGKEIARPTGMDDVRDALRYGVPLIPHVIGGLLIATADRFILSSVSGIEEVGRYTVAFQVAMGISLVFDAINKTYHPHLLESAVKNVGGRLLVKRAYQIVGVNFVLALAYATAFHYAFPFIVGHQYSDFSELIFLFVLAHFFRSVYYMTAIFISVANKNSYLARNTLISGVLGLLITAWLVNLYSSVGAAIGYTIGQFISLVLNWHSSNKVFPLPWFSMLYEKNTHRR